MIDLLGQVVNPIVRWVRSRLAPAVGWTSGSDTQVYARARPESVRLTERYYVRQEISGNPQKETSAPPTGDIEVRLPFDGFEYFTRQACADVKLSSARHRPGEELSVLIGHLMFANHTRTDLSDVVGLRQRYGSVPIQVPVDTFDADGGMAALKADRQQCVVSYEYQPDQARLIPIHLTMELLDPDTIDYYFTEAITEHIDNPPKGMTGQVGFQPYLILRVVVRATVPRAESGRNPRPEVENVSLRWPTITSLRAVKLRVATEEPVPVRYNPLTRSIEWSGIEMSLDGNGDGDTAIYQTKPMVVLIEQPGELYQQESLEGSVEVRIDDYLLSGVEARLANGIGRFAEDDQPEHVTYLNADVKLILDDAFAKRMVSPYQHLCFEGVIPDQMRIDDIKAALHDRGFEVDSPLGGYRDVIHLLAKRSEGVNKMVLWLRVEGRQFDTEREIKRPGGLTDTRTIESGELKVFIRGSLQRDSLQVIREMNALQQALRERFGRLRASH
jgi:hypothetical protein